MISSGTLTITPNENYVVTASDFSVSSLPTNITSVAFTDTSTAGQPGNTVVVTATFDTLFVMTASTTINLNISGDAKVWDSEGVNVSRNIDIIDNTNTNVFGSSTITAETGYTVSTTTSGDIATTSITGNIIKNTSTKVAKLAVIATSDYYFKSKSYLEYTNISSNILKLVLQSVVKDSGGRITRYNFNIMLNSDTDIAANSRASIFNIQRNYSTGINN